MSIRTQVVDKIVINQISVLRVLQRVVSEIYLTKFEFKYSNEYSNFNLNQFLGYLISLRS